jgi:GNAT superfamily N-acetyltransferase
MHLFFAVKHLKRIFQRCSVYMLSPILMMERCFPCLKLSAILSALQLTPTTKYVAFCERKIVGTFALLIMDNLAHMGTPSAIIEDVAVDPEWQGRGVGTQMMKYAFQICGEKGCYKAALSSNLNRKRAHAFYESLDFEQHGYSYRISLQPNKSSDSSQAAPR